MINEQATFDKFGYYSTNLRPFSSKPVIATCDSCKCDREVKKHVGAKSSVCIKCQRITQAKKIGRANRFGRKHTKETKEKIKESHLKLGRKGELCPSYGRVISDEHKMKLAESSRNREWTDESRAKLSAAHKGKKLSYEQRKKMGLSRTGVRNPNYGKSAAHGKGKYYTRSNGEIIWTRSSWEYLTAVYLDANNYEWEYEFEAFPITYVHQDKLKEGTFRPDFKVYINGQEEIWEIKGYWRDDARQKFNAFIEQYPNIKVKVLQKDDLIGMRIIEH
jgi:hypothetical protein